VRAKFEQEGWRVVELTRNQGTEEMRDGRAIAFRLGEEIAVENLRGARALVHCAYDFSLRKWEDIHRINVLGSDKLFRAAHAAGVEKRVFISSISAYEDCRSLYGKAKLEIENRLRAVGVLSLRPGLIYGDKPKGIVGSLVKQAGKSKLLPLLGGGEQMLYLSHQEDLARAIFDYANGRIPAVPEPITAAHEQGWTFRAILEEFARVQHRKLRLIKAPWRPVWLAIKCCELCGIKLDFRSDSLVSLMYQNPAPEFEPARRLGMKFRPYAAEKLRL
jgi:nucleoside-diphosphate-sugar epimerase